MARIRTIKPEFWTSEQVAECSPIARLLFVGMWNFCDDGGVHPASAKRLKMEVVPGDAMTDAEVEACVEELIEQDLIRPFVTQGKRYWWVTGWRHQKIDRPSFKYPRHPFDEDSTNTRRTLDEHSPPEGKGIGKGRGKEKEEREAPAEPPPPPPRFDPKKADLPKPLNTPAFQAAWLDWCHHRTEIRKPLRPTSVQQQLRELADWGHDRAVAALRHTIAKGWQGIREPETRGSPVAAGKPSMDEVLRKIRENNQ